MKYKYLLKELNMNGYKKMYFNLEEGMEPVTVFLNNDIGSDESAKIFIEKINKVQNGELKSPYTFGGNTCSLDIRTNIIYVRESFMQKRVASIEPKELILLIEAYILEKKKFRDSK